MSDPRVVALACTDLVFRAKLREAVAAAGFEPRALGSRDPLPDGAAALVVDLGDSRADPIARIRDARAVDPSLPVLAFASHVRDDQLAAGRDAGATLVVPRSGTIARLAALLAALTAESPRD